MDRPRKKISRNVLIVGQLSLPLVVFKILYCLLQCIRKIDKFVKRAREKAVILHFLKLDFETLIEIIYCSYHTPIRRRGCSFFLLLLHKLLSMPDFGVDWHAGFAERTLV